MVEVAVRSNGKHRARIQVPSQKKSEVKIRNTKLKSKPKSGLRTQARGWDRAERQGLG